MSALTTYRLDRHRVDGVDVFALDGGMSAEYAVQEALASLTGGVAHTWEVQEPGLGPNPVVATETFLADSITRTVEAYDSLGADIAYDTVVMGTGVSSASYVSHVLGAPFLPLHFLASMRTIAQTQRVLDAALGAGMQSYATLAYDESMPTTAVAWIKLLALPQAYRDFLVRHRVRRVVLIGTRGLSPHLARRPIRDGLAAAIAPAEVLVTWPDGGSQYDETWLNRTIDDLDETALEPEAFRIVDWESGLSEEAIAGVLTDLRADSVDVWMLTADDYLAAYDIATYAQAAAIGAPERILLNPYLITHPFAESVSRSLPLLYWQLDAADVTIGRLERSAREATGLDIDAVRALPVVVNATRNVGGPAHAAALTSALRDHGFTDVTSTDTTVDELFGPEQTDTPFWRAHATLTQRSIGDEPATTLTIEQLRDALASRTDMRLHPAEAQS